jgi:uncharacterized NAD-dependent epimerase/dehydratase family protein
MALPSIQQVIDLTIACGQLTNPSITCAGIAVNTQKLGEDEAKRIAGSARPSDYGVPASDPIRFGVSSIVDRIAAMSGTDA